MRGRSSKGSAILAGTLSGGLWRQAIMPGEALLRVEQVADGVAGDVAHAGAVLQGKRDFSWYIVRRSVEAGNHARRGITESGAGRGRRSWRRRSCGGGPPREARF